VTPTCVPPIAENLLARFNTIHVAVTNGQAVAGTPPDLMGERDCNRRLRHKAVSADVVLSTLSNPRWLEAQWSL
jgi:hypothetical protein